jgi:hypothetical protein
MTTPIEHHPDLRKMNCETARRACNLLVKDPCSLGTLCFRFVTISSLTREHSDKVRTIPKNVTSPYSLPGPPAPGPFFTKRRAP